jgi:hypothetical protein
MLSKSVTFAWIVLGLVVLQVRFVAFTLCIGWHVQYFTERNQTVGFSRAQRPSRLRLQRTPP